MSVTSALVVLGARCSARAYLYPTRAVNARPAPAADGIRLSTWARDGVSVRAIELRAIDSRQTIVLFHNNRQTAESLLDVGRLLVDRGFDVVLAEYRGYGASSGEDPTEEGLYADAEAILDALADRGIGPDRIVLWGTSLGTGVAAEMARRGRGARLVLVSPYTSIPNLVDRRLARDSRGNLGPRPLRHPLQGPGDPIPTLVVHGDDDEIVPFHMGEELSRDIPSATLLAIRGGGHHDDVLSRDGGRALSEIAAFAM